MINPDKPVGPAFDKAADWIAYQETQLTDEQRRRYEERKKEQEKRRKDERQKLDALLQQHEEIKKRQRLNAKLHLAMGATRGNPALQEKVQQIRQQKDVTERLDEQIEQERVAELRKFEQERKVKQEYQRVAGTGEVKDQDDALARAFDKVEARDAEKEKEKGRSREEARQLSRTFNDAARQR